MADGHVPKCALTDKNLVDISNSIGNGWESLAVYLKIPQAKIDHIKADHKSMQQQIYNMLLKWRNTEGCNATFTSLFDNINKVPHLTIDFNALQDIAGSFVDCNVLQKRSDHCQQACPQVSMDIAQIGHIPATIASLSQVPLTDKSVCGTDDKIAEMLQQDLIIYYRKELSKLQLSPLFDEDGYAADFFDFYVKPKITILGQPRSKVQTESTPVTFHDIFNCKPRQNIYISSPAGCGKTAFAKYLTLIWCQAHLPVESSTEKDNNFIEADIMEMNKVMFLFFVFLRDEHERECDVDIMIQNQLLPKLANSTTYTEKGLKFLENLLTNMKCIIILDGLDEWSHRPGNECTLHNKQIPYIRARPQCITVTTSRPWKLDVVRIKPEDIDQKLEINTLEDCLLRRLIQNVLKKLYELPGKEMQAYDDMKADDFEQELKDKKLTDLSKIPVVVMQLLTVWFDNEQLGESQCKIFCNMVEFLLKRYCKKRESVSAMEDIEADDCSRDRKIPMCLNNNMYCNIHKDLLSNLATLAYNTLFTTNEKTSLVFDISIAQKYLTKPEIEMSLAVGILTQEKVLGKISVRLSHISFIHKTFQEYLAALYVAFNPGMVTNVEEEIKRVCCSIEKVLEMSQIFMFLSGLCPEVMVDLHEHLRKTVSEDGVTQRYRASYELDAWSSEGWTLWQVQETMVEWLGECWLNEHKHVTHLPLSDFFIDGPYSRKAGSLWSAELKSLADHNPVFSLFVVDDKFIPKEIDDILNFVTEVNSIQKLWLSRVSEAFVVQLVSQHKYSLSARPETWRHLERITLEGVDMSSDIFCSLVDSILQLPKSVHVSLGGCSIYSARDWKEYIRSSPRLTVDNDDRTSVKFHTSKV